LRSSKAKHFDGRSLGSLKHIPGPSSFSYHMKMKYEEWQLSSRNAPVKAVFNYLHTNGFCHLRSSLLAHQYTSWVGASTAQNISKLLFWNTLQDGHRVSLNVGNVGPPKRSSLSGIAKSYTGPNLAHILWMVRFHYRIFGQKLPDSERVMSKGVMMQDPSIRPKFWSSPTNNLT
jgi:hypothetical protein